MPNPPGKDGYYWGTGRRKEASARVRLLPEGSGQVIVNDRPLEAYFRTEDTRHWVLQPLQEAGLLERFNVLVNVRGGGPSGQAQAVRMGIARALLGYEPDLDKGDESRDLVSLRRRGYLTQDSRVVERKKYGKAGARKRFQYSKR